MALLWQIGSFNVEVGEQRMGEEDSNRGYTVSNRYYSRRFTGLSPRTPPPTGHHRQQAPVHTGGLLRAILQPNKASASLQGLLEGGLSFKVCCQQVACAGARRTYGKLSANAYVTMPVANLHCASCVRSESMHMRRLM